MEYRYLGQTGLRVSNLCLGTMTFGHNAGRPGQADLETSHKMLDRFVAKGGNFIDTADVYQYGESERIVGSWINKIGSEKRKKLIIATKLFAVNIINLAFYVLAYFCCTFNRKWTRLTRTPAELRAIILSNP